MSKTIWYISKYIRIETKNSIGDRGWLLMKELASKGNKPIIITSDSQHLMEQIDFSTNIIHLYPDGIKFILLKTYKYLKPNSIRRIFSWFDFEWNLFAFNKTKLLKPDVIIVSSLSLLTIINGIFLKKKYKCKLVFEIRDIWPLTLTEIGGFSPNNFFIRILGFIERLGYRKSDLIVGTMPNLIEHVEKVLGYKKSVSCIPMGISTNIFKRNQKLTQDYIDTYLKSGCFNIIYTGTIGVANALETFLQAAENFKTNYNIKFIIVGDGPLKRKYEKKYYLFQNIIFAPKVEKDQVQSVLAYADVLYFSVFKSKIYNYGQSLNKIIDYMVAKKPIIASYSGYPSMINEAGCGYFIPAEDVESLTIKIKETYSMTKTERKSMGCKGLKWLLKNRTYKKLAEDYFELLFKKV
jgi:glycosyltransferase involved in cell wall biosynthesis